MAQQQKQDFLPAAKKGYSLPAGIAVFPKLDTPDTKFNAMGVFKTGVRLEGEVAQKVKADIDALIEQAYAATKAHLIEAGEAKEKDGDVLLLKDGKPQKDKNGKLKVLEYADRAYKEELDDEGNETGAIVFNTKTNATYKDKTGKVVNRKVPVVDAKVKPMHKAVWGGSKIIVNVDLSPFFTAVGVGVSLRLNAVQVLELRSGGRDVTSMFEEQEGYEESQQDSVDSQQAGASADADADDDIPL